MDEASFHWWLAVALLVSGLGAFVRLLWGSQAPYGRYNNSNGSAAAAAAAAAAPTRTTRSQTKQSVSANLNDHGYGPDMNARLAWFLMESPNLWVSAICVYWPGLADPACLRSATNRLLLGLFCLHYAQRTLLYPWLMPPTSRAMPVGIMGLAWLFCTLNGYLQARWLTKLHVYGHSNEKSWSDCPLTLRVGVALFLLGFALNIHADSILRGLARKRRRATGAGAGGYEIPRGGLFELVSAANYTAEMLEWGGFALASGLAYPAVVFALFTVLNLAPRGMAHHRWYQAQFGSKYPKGRKALIPFLW